VPALAAKASVLPPPRTSILAALDGPPITRLRSRLQDMPWYNTILWDTSGCCNMYTNDFWSLVRALFGYTGMQRLNVAG
jgi:uncharacterized protein with von Willebrand factor type A (vWA) domain